MPRRMLAKSRHKRNTKSHRRRRATRKSKHFSRRLIRGGVRDDLPTVASVQGIPMPASYMEERVDFPGGFMTVEEYRRALEKGSLHDATQ